MTNPVEPPSTTPKIPETLQGSPAAQEALRLSSDPSSTPLRLRIITTARNNNFRPKSTSTPHHTHKHAHIHTHIHARAGGGRRRGNGERQNEKKRGRKKRGARASEEEEGGGEERGTIWVAYGEQERLSFSIYVYLSLSFSFSAYVCMCIYMDLCVSFSLPLEGFNPLANYRRRNQVRLLTLFPPLSLLRSLALDTYPSRCFFRRPSKRHVASMPLSLSLSPSLSSTCFFFFWRFRVI